MYRFLLSVAAAVLPLVVATIALAAITVTPDPEGGMNRETAAIFTTDPWDFVDLEANPAARPAARGLAGDRHLRQTFQNPFTLNVGEIILSYDVTNTGVAAEVGMAFRFFEVNDVTAAWSPGILIKEFVITDPIPGNDRYMSFEITGGDVFALPARGSASDTLGYGIEISTANADTADGNPGVWFWTTTDEYLEGRAYREGAAPGGDSGDFGLSLFGSTESPCDPGDVNCMDGVTIADLEIIAANFRKPGGRDQGDLTGNGFIDFDDFDEWKRHYPGAFPASALSLIQSLNVPEPASGMLLLCGMVGLLATRRRR